MLSRTANGKFYHQCFCNKYMYVSVFHRQAVLVLLACGVGRRDVPVLTHFSGPLLAVGLTLHGRGAAPNEISTTR